MYLRLWFSPDFLSVLCANESLFCFSPMRSVSAECILGVSGIMFWFLLSRFDLLLRFSFRLDVDCCYGVVL